MSSDFIDYYALLSIPNDAAPIDIRRAYRTLSLKCHPDKVGTDNLELNQMFLSLTQAYDVLTDDDKKRSYDALWNTRMQRQKKVMEMDAVQQKLRRDLEAREQAGMDKMEREKELQQEREEIERLRSLGLEKLKQQTKKPTGETVDDKDKTLKIRWKVKPDVKQWSQSSLQTLLSSFGPVEHVIVKESSSKASALVQFGTIPAAASVADAKRVKDERLKGLDVEWLSTASLEKEPYKVEEWRMLKNAKITLDYTSPDMNDDEYEAMTLSKMRAMKTGA